MLLAFIFLIGSLRADCFCGDLSSNMVMADSSLPLTVSDLVGFIDLSIARLNAIGIEIDEEGNQLAISSVTSLNFPSSDKGSSVEVFYKFFNLIPVKVTITQTERAFEANFFEVRHEVAEGKPLSFDYIFEQSADKSAVVSVCRFFYIGLSALLKKNFDLDLDSFLLTEDKSKCAAKTGEFSFYMRKSLVTSMIPLPEEQSPEEKPSAAEKISDELDSVIAGVDEHESSNSWVLPSFLLFGNNFMSYAMNPMFRKGVGNKLTKRPTQHRHTSSTLVDLDLLATEVKMINSMGDKAKKPRFIRNKSLYIRPEGQVSYTITETEINPELLKEPLTLDERHILMEYIYDHSAIRSSSADKLNCDVYHGDDSSFYVSLYNSETTQSVMRDGFNGPSVARTLIDASEEQSQALIKIIFDSRAQSKIEKGLRDRQSVLQEVNVFNENVPITPHQRHELQSWVISSYPAIVKANPKAKVTIYSDFSMYIESVDKPVQKLVGELKTQLAQLTEREAKFKVVRTEESELIRMVIGTRNVDFKKFGFSTEGMQEMNEIVESLLAQADDE